VRLIGNLLAEPRGKARFADPRLARNQHHLPLTAPSEPPPLFKQRHLRLAADKTRQPARPHHFEPALRRGLALHRPGLDRLANPLDRQPAESTQPEQLAEQPAGRGRNHDRPRRCQRLQPRCEVGGLADHRLLLRRQIAGHHQPGRNANARFDLFPARCPQPTDHPEDVQPGAHRPLGVILMRLRIAEIDHHPIAHELGEMTLVAGDDADAGIPVGAVQPAQILWIEPRRKRRRAHQVAKHHRHLAAFGRRQGRHIAGRRRPDTGGLRAAECRYGGEQPPAMPDQADAEFLQILARQAL
jgi:hypothetical protein